MTEIDTEMIRRAQAGDTEKISELYQRFNLPVFRYLYYRVGDTQIAEDLTSEVFLRMLRFIGGFEPPSTSFQAWLFQIARNLANDHFRKAGARPLMPLDENMKAAHEDLDMSTDRSLTSEKLRRAMDKLTEDQRDVIVLRFVAQMPIAEVAQTLNKSEDAVKGLQRRSLLALRDLLSEMEVSYA